MSSPNNLLELYIDEMRDLWSANDQMARVVKDLATNASDQALKSKLSKSLDGIDTHTRTLQAIIEGAGGKTSKDHCRGMEGLVTEAKKHALKASSPAEIKDIEIIAQYQRMCHYGIAGFGTAKAYAEALGRAEDAAKLDKALSEIYDADEWMSDLAARAEKLAAQHVK